jgi:hypothetical protein
VTHRVASSRRRWPHRVLAAVAAVALLPAVVACSDDEERAEERADERADESGDHADDGGAVVATGDVGRDVPDGAPVTCPDPTVEVGDADELAAALAAAEPGDVIELAPGTYLGRFVATAQADPGAPIFLCGPREAVLDGDGIRGGYALHLDGASGWRLVGFTVRNAQKGVVVDRGVGHVIQGLRVEEIGDEAIHLRTRSTDNVVRDNVIRRTGLRRDRFGEGVYVGSAESNWCRYTECDPDRSDRNLVEGNDIAETGAESVDLKEGTTGGVVRGNTFDGDGMTGADSWVDVKGNGWLIEGNTGTRSPLDGFQVHEIRDGWGQGNVFRSNVADVDGEGFGIATTNARDLGNVVACNNEISGAGAGFADVDCGP